MHVANLMLAALWDAQLVRWVVWVGLVALTVALLLLIRTRWGQQPLAKCVVLSLLAHVLLAIYMTTVTIVTATSDSPDGKGVQVAIVDGSQAELLDDALAPERWSAIAPDATAMPVDPAEPAATKTLPLGPIPESERTATKLPDVPTSEEATPPEALVDVEPVLRSKAQPTEPAEIPPPEPTDDARLEPVPRTDDEPPTTADADDKPDAAAERSAAQQPAAAAEANKDVSDLDGSQTTPAVPLPKIYQGRAGDRLQHGKANGATRQSEAAVAAALRWLAAQQAANGRWDPRQTEGGSGRAADGEPRGGAGATADTGITGLALLAFLASGHTHLDGAHRDTVRRALEFLLASQDATGSLGATSNVYERMYCHAMATCALSEAYAMTGDKRLLPAVRSAIDYTVRNQDRASGGWRYQPGQPGDTSQLGWQVLALKSAELGGIPMSHQTRSGIERFLRGVALGRWGGLACYQPARPATRSMTAEALVCRQFLGRLDHPETLREASEHLLQELPGSGVTNHYYWYYATLGLFQAQGDAWRQWNAALQKNLLATQRLDGAMAGSWDPDPVWGRCGGRVYSTALSALCLEVYYRYLPLYVEAAARE